MFNTGFTMNVEKCSEEVGGPTMRWMLEQATKATCVVTGSLIIQEDGLYYNRLIWMRPDGTYDQHDRHHLFSLAEEETIFTAGARNVPLETNTCGKEPSN